MRPPWMQLSVHACMGDGHWEGVQRLKTKGCPCPQHPRLRVVPWPRPWAQEACGDTVASGEVRADGGDGVGQQQRGGVGWGEIPVCRRNVISHHEIRAEGRALCRATTTRRPSVRAERRFSVSYLSCSADRHGGISPGMGVLEQATRRRGGEGESGATVWARAATTRGRQR